MNSMPMDETHRSEVERIRREYQRRSAELPADLYSLAKPANLFSQAEFLRVAIPELHRRGFFPFNGRKVLDVGCGRGNWLLQFELWGADPQDLSGIDLDERRLDQARKRLPGSDLRQGDASCLPWGDATFDVISQFVVFTSILSSSMKRALATEMQRVLKPDGVILWYDFRYNNPNNQNVRGIKASEIRELFAGCQVDLQAMTLAPPLARALTPISWTMSHLLEKLPFLRTHYLGLIRKVSRAGA